MKNLLRNPGVQTFLSWLLWLHLIITLKSRRWTHDNLCRRILNNCSRVARYCSRGKRRSAMAWLNSRLAAPA